MTRPTGRRITSVEDVHGLFRTGRVEGANTWSETRVSATTTGGGGSGQIYQGTGRIDIARTTTQVSSSATEMSRFFLNFGDDDEEEFKLRGGNFPVRDGHAVSVIRIGAKGEDRGYNVAFYNHATRACHAPEAWLKSPVGSGPTKAFLFLGGGLVALAFVITKIVSGRETSPAVFIALGLLAVAVFFYMRKNAAHHRLIEAVRARRQQEIEAAKAAYAAGKTRDTLKETEA